VSVLSVLIPTLNERARLPGLLDQLAQQQGVRLQVVVADGGSSDETVAIAHGRGARVVQAERGRGRQLNAGRGAVDSGWLLVLHADSRLTHPRQLRRALDCIEAAAQTAGPAVAGHFQLAFHDADGPFFAYYEGLSALGRPRTVNGDQGLLIHSDWLDRLGGFRDELPFLEDQALGEQVAASGAWVLLPDRLETSARRFLREGTVERSIYNAAIVAFFSFRHAPFLAMVPGLYRSQTHAGRLRVSALVREVGRMLWAEPALLLRLGRFLSRDGLWRGFFWMDVRAHGPDAVRFHPRLDFHDRYLSRLLHTPTGDRVCAPLVGLVWCGLWWRFRRDGDMGGGLPEGDIMGGDASGNLRA